MAHRLLHPSSETARHYEVTLCGPRPPDLVERLLAGIELDDGLAAADSASLQPGSGAGESRLRIELHEGRNREIRRMMDALGVRIASLKRLAFGPVKLGALPAGEWRELSGDEVAALRTLADGEAEEGGP